MRSRTILRAGQLGVLCATAYAQSYLPPIGGPGGGQFQLPCPSGQYLTGVELHAADDVDAVRPVCSTATGVSAAPTRFAGGSGGAPVSLRCPSRIPAVLALRIIAEGAETVVVNNVHLYCGLPVPNQPVPDYPSAVFDGPAAVPSKPAFPGDVGGAPIFPAGSSQSCPGGQIATGIHGRSGVWLDAVGLICGLPPAAPPGVPVKSIGRVNTQSTPENHASLCDSAADARARNSPAAPALQAECNKLRAQITANETRDLTPGPSGAPVSICDAAQSALDRNAIEASDLAAKCRAIGGGQSLTTPADQFAAAGQALADGDPLLSELRNRQPAGGLRRGFDIGTGASAGQTQWGPGKQRMLDSLKPDEQEGFRIAVSFALDRNRNTALAAAGAAIASLDPTVAQARTQDRDVRYWLGFDIGSALFGDPALGGAGHTSTGSGSDAIRNGLSPAAQRGFLASVRFHLSRKH